jgi:hypothetical protein
MLSNPQEWRNQNSGVKFPFRESAGLESTSGLLLPNGFLCDAQIFISGQQTSAVYLASISIQGTELQGTVNHGSEVVGVFAIDFTSPATADIVAPDGRTCGKVIPGQAVPDVFRSLEAGATTFDPQESEFESSCVVQLPGPALTAIRLAGVPHFGKVCLVEGMGIRLVREARDLFRIDADNTSGDQNCQDSEAILPAPIKTINAVLPGQYGNINIEPGDYPEPQGPADKRQIIRVSSVENGIMVYIIR